MHRLSTVLAAVALGGSLVAQSFNVSFGNGPAPDASYGAVGDPGVWNVVPGVQLVHYSLVRLDGSSSPVTMRQIGGNALLQTNDPLTSGDDEALMDSYLATFDVVETCQRFFNLQNGLYEVITYAWMPANPSSIARVVVDESLQGFELVGGAWPGGHADGITFAVHVARVVNGELNSHSGLSVGGQPAAAMNGIQLRYLGPCTIPYQTPGSVTNLGGGCGDSGSPGVEGPPAVGNLAFALTLTGAGPFVPTLPSGALLNLAPALEPQPLGSCELTSYYSVLPVSITGGDAFVPTPIPCDPGLRSVTLRVQWTVAFVTTGGALQNVAFSDNLDIRIGS